MFQSEKVFLEKVNCHNTRITVHKDSLMQTLMLTELHDVNLLTQKIIYR